MSYNSVIRFLSGVAAALLIAATPALADSLQWISSSASQNSNDSINWQQLGADASPLNPSFNVTSAKLLKATGSLTGSGSLTAVVCPATVCSWAGAQSGFIPGETLIWTSDTGNSGNGPLTIDFAQKVAGAGAFIQADGPSQFTAQLQAFDGSTMLGSTTETSDSNGDPIYFGVNDSTGANISSIVYSITSCEGDCSDFAIDTMLVNNPSVNPGNTVLHWAPHSILFPRQHYGMLAATSSKSPSPFRVKVINPNKKTNTTVTMNTPSFDMSDYSVDPGTTTCGSDMPRLNPGQSCFIGLVFKPTALGVRLGHMMINDNASAAPQIVTLHGVSIPPILQRSPSILMFGGVMVNTISAVKTVSLKNNSPIPISLGSPSIVASVSGAFNIASNDCGSTLSNVAGSNICHIGVTLTPSATGRAIGFLLIYNNDNQQHSPQQVKLVGRGK
ncbi:MAG: choice-of-anchor D domain-containing protein [Candidatus Binataceae bacterium]|nr:choice-of-anchor D domain-containing protein [Candidatus Binataceae bacterium]